MNNTASDFIEVALVSDANYASFLATTVVSILKSSSESQRLRLHIVDAGLTNDDIKKIRSLQKIRDCEMVFYKPDLSQYLDLFSKGTLPKSCFYRLFLPRYLPAEIEKILYLDVDVVVLDDLAELWNAPLDDEFVAAARDVYVPDSHKKMIGVSQEYPYFNSGVLLMNVKKWRDENIVEKLLEQCDELAGKSYYLDQDYLNLYAYRASYRHIEDKWNCHPHFYREGETKIMHYMGPRLQLPHLDILLSFAKQTPYKKLPFQKLSYRVMRPCKIAFCKFVSFFLFKGKWRRAFRQRFNMR